MLRVDAEGVKNGGVQIGRAAGLFGGLEADGIGFAINLPATNAAAGKDGRVRTREMITTGAFVDLRRAAKIGEHYNERFIKATAFAQILHQRRRGLIEGRQHIVF